LRHGAPCDRFVVATHGANLTGAADANASEVSLR
jgi:hypothetical protein